MKSKYWQRTHKYIRVPKSVKEALEIDEEMHNIYWRDNIDEEMKKVKEMDTFKVYNGEPGDLFGYKQISTHFKSDV